MRKEILFYILPLYLVIAFLIISISIDKVGRVTKNIEARVDTDYSQEHEGYVQGYPKELIIPSISIDLDVIDGNYDQDNASWNVSNDKVHFATVTAIPNNKYGNTLIYGHNLKNIFGRLDDVGEGDTAYIKTSDRITFTYEFYQSKVINPSDTDVLNNTDQPILSLLTCKGLLNEKRVVYLFKLTNYE